MAMTDKIAAILLLAPAALLLAQGQPPLIPHGSPAAVGPPRAAEPLEFGEVGELFPDSAAEWSAVFGCLPLAEGYSATFRNLSLLSQKVQSMELKVVGVETVTVPAGKFETWKVAIASAEGLDHTTLWVAKESRATVKWSSVLVASGSSATETAELLP